MKKAAFLLSILSVLFTARLFAQAGTLDNTFGTNGTVTTIFDKGASEIWGMGLQTDHKIVAGGFAMNGTNEDFALARYNENGSLDTSFGVKGIVYTAIGDSDDLSFALAIQPDGKILLGGFSYVNNKGYDFAVVRYKIDGSLDSSFANNGVALAAMGAGDDFAYSMALQQDWSVVVGGTSFNGTNNDFAIARFTTNGVLDPHFGNNGKVITQMGPGDESVNAMLIQSDWGIVVGGGAYNGVHDDFAMARYDSTGTLDPTFGAGGKVFTSIGANGSEVYAITKQPDRKILATGYAATANGNEFALSRYTTAGILDTSFAHTGIATTIIGDSVNAMFAVTLQPDGKIVSAGSMYNGAVQNCALTRYNTDGTLDQNFGSGGKVVTPLSAGRNIDYAVAIQQDGKIIASGYSGNDTVNNYALARYISGLNLGTIDLSASGNSLFIYPNPLKEDATLEYTLKNEEDVSICLFDMQGKMVKTFMNHQKQEAGVYKQAIALSKELASGSYLVTISSVSGSISVKVVK